MKKHLYILYIIASLFLIASCGPDGNSFRIKGKFQDMPAGELYIYNLSDDYAKFDTILVQNGEFLYKGQTEECTPYILVFPNGMEQVIFVNAGEELRYEAVANDLRRYVVNGSDENKLMNEFRNETYSFNSNMVKATARTFITEHASSPVAIYLFDRYFVQDDEVADEEVVEILHILKKSQPDNKFLLQIEGLLANFNATKTGKPLPDVELTDRNGKHRKLWSSAKDYNLFVFWSAGMQQGMDFIFRMRMLANDKHESLRIASISLDIDHQRWLYEAKQDSANNYIEHYNDDLAFESPVIKKLGIKTFPSYILTDRSHKIIATGDRVDQMKQDVEKYMK